MDGGLIAPGAAPAQHAAPPELKGPSNAACRNAEPVPSRGNAEGKESKKKCMEEKIGFILPDIKPSEAFRTVRTADVLAVGEVFSTNFGGEKHVCMGRSDNLPEYVKMGRGGDPNELWFIPDWMKVWVE